MQAEGFNQNGTNDLVSILLRSGVTVYISEAYLENDKKLCSDLFNQNSNTVQDSSGYNNNSTITGELLLNSESPRYKNCIAFTNSSYLRSIDKVATFLPTDAITVNLWIKYSTWGNPISCTQGGGWNFEETSNGIQFPLYVSGVGYKTANSGITSATLANSYHMLTGTFDKTNVKIYIDGELKATTATNSTNGIGYANNYLFISAEAQGDTITPASSTFVGNISDVRIYATALSAEDIRQLYEVSGKIDNLGNLYSYEFIEEDTYKPIAQKNGIIKINNFIEQYNYLYLPSGTFINTELNYNAGDSCKAETVIRYESGGSGRDLMGYSTSGAGY